MYMHMYTQYHTFHKCVCINAMCNAHVSVVENACIYYMVHVCLISIAVFDIFK